MLWPTAILRHSIWLLRFELEQMGSHWIFCHWRWSEAWHRRSSTENCQAERRSNGRGKPQVSPVPVFAPVRDVCVRPVGYPKKR